MITQSSEANRMTSSNKSAIREEITSFFPEPKCAGCGAGVGRPKCMFEMGGDCPRHAQREEWQSAMWKAERAARCSEAGDIPDKRVSK